MGKRVLITGSTDGIGRKTALQLARKGWDVVIHGRKEERVAATVERIRQDTGNPDITGVVGDLASLKAVTALAATCLERFERLDALVANAGVFQTRFERSADGYEMTFAVNHLAHFLLVRRLLPLLERSSEGRIVIVSSMAHASRIDFGNLQGEKGFDGYEAYGVSKLCNLLFGYKLARDLKETGISVNSLHPGVINTKLLKAGWGGIGAPVHQGAETPVYLVDSPEVAGMTGQYFVNRVPSHSAPVSYDLPTQQRLWELSEELCEKALSQDPF